MTTSVSSSSSPVRLQYCNPDQISRTTEAINPKTGKSEPIPAECVICLHPLHSDAADLQGHGLLKKLVTHTGENGDKHLFHAECLKLSIAFNRRVGQPPSCPICRRKITMLPSDIKGIEKSEEAFFIKEAQGSIKAVKHNLVAAAVTGLATTILCQTGLLGVFGTALTIGITAISAASQQRIELMKMGMASLAIGIGSEVYAALSGATAEVAGARLIGAAGAAGATIATAVALVPLRLGEAVPAENRVIAVAFTAMAAAFATGAAVESQSAERAQEMIMITMISSFAYIIFCSEGGISNAVKLVKRTAIAFKRCLWPANPEAPGLAQN